MNIIQSYQTISSTFYERIFCTKFWRQKNSNPKHSFEIFGTKISYEKSTRKMLMKYHNSNNNNIYLNYVLRVFFKGKDFNDPTKIRKLINNFTWLKTTVGALGISENDIFYINANILFTYIGNYKLNSPLTHSTARLKQYTRIFFTKKLIIHL